MAWGVAQENLNTELIANYYNSLFGEKYDVLQIIDLISEFIMPIAAEKEWGYTPYMYLTGLYQCHPNFAVYLLEEHHLTVSEFRNYLKLIPNEMKAKCRKPYVEELYQEYVAKFHSNDVK